MRLYFYWVLVIGIARYYSAVVGSRSLLSDIEVVHFGVSQFGTRQFSNSHFRGSAKHSAVIPSAQVGLLCHLRA